MARQPIEELERGEYIDVLSDLVDAAAVQAVASYHAVEELWQWYSDHKIEGVQYTPEPVNELVGDAFQAAGKTMTTIGGFQRLIEFFTDPPEEG